MLILAITAHFHSPSHSPRFLLGIFILSILTLILTLLAFLIDVLLFVPHMAWGSYIVLAATILIAASGIVSCAMRRTLVSRKARKRRIDENAEMNGENFRARLGTDPIVPPIASTMVSGGLSDNKLPSFAQFDSKVDGNRTSDERIPLTTRTPSETSPNNIPGGPAMGMNDRFGGSARDQYGNPMPMPPPSSFGMRSRDPSTDPSLNRQYTDDSMNSRGRGGMQYNRGRGGYGPPGRGGYGPPPGRGYRGGFGNPNGGRGGYGPPGPNRGPPMGVMNDGMMAGAVGGMAAGGMMRGGRGGPPPGYGQRGGYERNPSPGYGRRPSESSDGYARNASPRPPPPGGYAAYNPNSSLNSLPRAESPPPLPGMDDQGPVGQAVEMDATTGSPSTAPKDFGQFGQLRDSDGDVAGMVGLQQQRQDIGAKHETLMSATSRYSTDEYIPPRQVWAEGRSSPLNPASRPAELPNSSTGHKRISSGGDNYYEDVDPRFADEPANTNSLMPAALHPKSSSGDGSHTIGMDGNNSYEDLSGSRSPAESERSTFTSISQRGVNPRWNGQNGYGAPMPRRPPQPRGDDILLNSNPDFQLPAGRGRGPPSRGVAGRGGMIPGSAYPGPGPL
jgi:hypothetical protein